MTTKSEENLNLVHALITNVEVKASQVEKGQAMLASHMEKIRERLIITRKAKEDQGVKIVKKLIRKGRS